MKKWRAKTDVEVGPFVIPQETPVWTQTDSILGDEMTFWLYDDSRFTVAMSAFTNGFARDCSPVLGSMNTFESHKQYSEFQHFVMRKSRHVLDERNRAFVQTVVETGKGRQGHIDKGTILWRAQVGITSQIVSLPKWVSLRKTCTEFTEWKKPVPFAEGRMAPLKDRAVEGRVNAKGIPCLYLSTDRDTAMTEVRPWVGANVSVAQFRILRDLTVVDCSGRYGRFSLLDKKELPPNEQEVRVWQDINSAFSEPVTRSDDVAEYAPTQILAEAFRNDDYDGVVYGSNMGAGITIAVFDLDASEMINSQWHQVKSMKLEFSDAEGTYCAEKYMDSDDGEVRDPTDPQYGRQVFPQGKKKGIRQRRNQRVS